jgi:hypothetical protein
MAQTSDRSPFGMTFRACLSFRPRLVASWRSSIWQIPRLHGDPGMGNVTTGVVIAERAGGLRGASAPQSEATNRAANERRSS